MHPDVERELSVGGTPEPAPTSGPPAWPTSDDVIAYSRLDPTMPAEELGLVESALQAAIAWVSVRVGDAYTVTNTDGSTTPAVTPNGWEATVMEAGRLYRRRDTLDGTLGIADIGVIRVGRFDADIEALLGPDLVTPL